MENATIVDASRAEDQNSNQALPRRIKKIKRRTIRFFLSALYFLPSLLILATKYRFIIVSNTDRIGHLAAEIDCFLKEIELGELPAVRPVLLLAPRKTANNCLLQYWSTHIHVVRSSLFRKLLNPFSRFPYLRITLFESVVAIGETATYPAVLARWGERPPLLRLSDSHRARGEALLQALGVPDGAWFVCIHSREGGYSPKDEQFHTHRNSDINSYRLAMESIVERGGWCLRMGDPTMAPLQPMQGVIDYATSEHKSDWMDVFLCAQCRFFLGNTSGLCIVSTVFGVPSALAHLTPISGAYPVGASDLGIPMLLKRQSGEPMNFAEMLDSPSANYRVAKLYRENALVTENNTPEEIRDLANEMIDRLDGLATYTDNDQELQNAFRSLFREGHYTYGAASRIGRDFLRSHSHLLPH